MMDQGKKCIAKKCKDCRLYISWDMENKNGLRKQVHKCILLVLAEEIPNIKGSVDGCQEAANEARNRALDTMKVVTETTNNYVNSLKVIAAKIKMLPKGRGL